MVQIIVKYESNQEEQFLIEATTDSLISDILESIVTIHNLRMTLKQLLADVTSHLGKK